MVSSEPLWQPAISVWPCPRLVDTGLCGFLEVRLLTRVLQFEVHWCDLP